MIQNRAGSGIRKKIGIVGGSFNPIHYGHLLAARSLLEQLVLDVVLLVPSARPPHKEPGGLEAEKHRYLMTRMAVCDDPHFEVSAIEMERPGLSFTVDTLAYFHRIYPEADLYLLLGIDALMQICSWKDPGQIAALCHTIVIVNRPGFDSAAWQETARQTSPAFADKLRFLEIPAVDISSTDIRQRIKAGLPISYLVPAAVEDYIASHGLYRQ